MNMSERDLLKQEIVEEVLAKLRPPVEPAPEEIPEQVPSLEETGGQKEGSAND